VVGGETPVATPVPPTPTARPEVPLGAPQRVEEGGFSFRPLPDYELAAFGGFVEMLAPGADPDIGPSIVLFGDTRAVMTTEALMEEFRSEEGGEEAGLRMGENQPVMIAGLPGLAADFSIPRDGRTFKGRIYVLMVTPTQQFAMLVGGPESAWAELEPLAEAVLASVEFFELVAPQPTSFVDPGWYPYTNPNVARDVLVYDELLYAATLGGLAVWHVEPPLDGGYALIHTPLDGMSHVSTYALAACAVPVAGGGRETRIVVGTLNGLSFYDPATGAWDTTPITPEESNVQTSKVDRLYCDVANNRLLIGYSGLGVLDLETGAWTRFTDREGLSWNAISDIAVIGRDIWVASGYNGISRISGDQVTVYDEDSGLPNNRANALAVGADGALWVGTSGGLARFRNNQWAFYSSRDVSGLSDIRELVFASDGTLWVGTASLGSGNLCRFDPAAETCVELYREPQGVLGLDLHEYNASPVYANSAGVYALVEGERSEFVVHGVMPATNFVDAFAAAPDGMLWLGTDSGIQWLDPAYPPLLWDTYTREDGVGGGSSGWAKALAVAPDGTVWAAITNGDASRFRDGVWTSYEGLRSYDSVAVDAQGRAWFGDEGNGIVVLNADGSRALELTADDGLPSNRVLALLADGPTMWIATDQGVARYLDGQVELVVSDALPHRYVRALALAPDGALLIGANLSIARYDGAEVEILYNFQQAGYMDWLTTLAVGRDGSIWAGTAKGLFHSDPDGQTWMRWTTADGLLTNFISALHVDQYGALWVGGGGSNYDGGGVLHIVP